MQRAVPASVTKHSEFKLDLGIPQLMKEWKAFFSSKYLKDDIISGATVACVAVPLSLAIALASGVSPAIGLITAIVSGVVCALFGGTPLAVSGPAAAMAVLIASIVEKFGVTGLLVVGLGTGLLQILTGMFGGGRLARLVPAPVIAGFTAGIGAIILIGQLPRALGLPPPDQAHIFFVIQNIAEEVRNTNLVDLTLVISTVGIIFLVPKVSKRIPAPLVAVLLPSIVFVALGLQGQTIGAIPRSLPMPKLPDFPAGGYVDLLAATFMVYALASLETLLSSSAVDRLAKKQKKHNPDQELIGQGLGNLASSLFGGLPVTGVIARSALNVQSGAKTRRSAIIHSVVLLAITFVFAPVISQIPVSVLAGVLISVALRMLNPKEFLNLWKVSRVEAGVFLVTFTTIVFLDLLMGVQAGIAAALLIVAIRFGKVTTTIHPSVSGGPCRLSIEGRLTFVSAGQISKFNARVEDLEPNQDVIFDCSRLEAIDASGAEQIIELIAELKNRGHKVALQSVHPTCQAVLRGFDLDEELNGLFAVTECDIEKILESSPSPIDRLQYGVSQFTSSLTSLDNQLFNRLSTQQNPHTLFITCSDSRINPNLITSTKPGELFVVRNVGNIIPPHGAHEGSSEAAAIEFAVEVLGVKEIVICAHSGCGAMRAVLSNSDSSANSNVGKWLAHADGVHDHLAGDRSIDEAARINARLQVENLKSYKSVQKRVKAGTLRIHAWYYDIGAAELKHWTHENSSFEAIHDVAKNQLTPAFSQ